MRSFPSSTTVATVDSNGSSLKYFIKDGRKISVCDCALVKPPLDSPPFIGIIRCLTSAEESNLTLSVNWLYRPAEVKLIKGVAPEAAPNEVFYSFCSDEIPAASLLHPCKVAFLPKVVELPPGVSSFVCRQVYDISHKCLWWLTDQDYVDDHQKEVNKLLYKTRIEMHGTAQQQQGARSPKPVNGSAATSPLKHSLDSMQNSSSNLSFQTKGKKRERGDQSFEPIKRERSIRAEDWDSGKLTSESMLNSEITKIAEKGGLVDSETVERIVQLMQPEKSERKIDLTGRSILAGIIADTDKLDCLSQFVQLKGLPVLDEWLQEVHKGKVCDPGNIKDGDKSVEDFLLVLLRALDKLPVNLNALQMCNIGKSVNHLRSHKSTEIQKKARSLVDRWKKRVEAEIKNDAAKSGSSQAVRSSVTHHSSLKSTSVKLVQGDSITKSASGYPGGARLALSPTSTTANYKEGQFRVSVNAASSEPSQAVVREEKSSSSSQSHTNSQCSSDHTKNNHKMTGSGSKLRKSANDLQRGTSVSRISVVEKMSDNVNAVDVSVHEANNHKLIVKISNRGSASQSIAGGFVEDSSCRNSRASAPALSEKHEQSNACLRESHDAHCRTNDENKRLPDVSKVASSPSRNEMKSKTALDSSFSSMNALVESCVKFSEANASMSAGDDVGMNLLASIAAGEISKSATISPSVSPHRNSSSAENSCSNYNGSKKQLHGDDFIQQQCQSSNVIDAENCNIDGGVPKVNGRDTMNHRGTSSEILHQNEEGGLKSNGKLDEQVCIVGRGVEDGGTEILNGKNRTVKEESHNQLPAVSQELGGSLAADDEIKDASLNESERRSQRGTEMYPSSNVDDKKNNVSQYEKTSVVFSSTDQENDPSPMPQKQEESGLSSIDKEHETICKDENMENKEALVHQPGSSAKQVTSFAVDQHEHEHEVQMSTKESNFTSAEEERKDEYVPATGGSDINTNFGFDLNEGLNMDDGKSGDSGHSGSSASGSLPASVTVTAAAKGTFVPPDDLLRHKIELGWKGSASTSAFRPAEPRKTRSALDIDLNVADERVLDVVGCSGGLDLDLNKVDEAADCQRLEVKASSSSNLSNGEASGRRGFDLNNGPATEEMHVEQTSPYNQHDLSNFPPQAHFRPTTYTYASGNCFPWYRESFPFLGVESGPHRDLTSNFLFKPDAYRGSMMSWTPSWPFQSTPLRYPVFPFGSSGFMDSGRVSAIPAAAVPIQYPHAYVVSPVPDVGCNSLVESNRKLGKSGLDLNSGPEGVRVEEQASMYDVAGGLLKRNEPEGGWTLDKFNFKQSSWR